MRSFIGFRLRDGLDGDLVIALEGVERKEISNLCRDGLRKVLPVKQAIAVTSQPIEIKSKPAIFIPKNKRGGGQQ